MKNEREGRGGGGGGGGLEQTLLQVQLQLNNFFCKDKLKFIFWILSNNFLVFIFSCFLWFGLSFSVDLQNQPFRGLVVWCVTLSFAIYPYFKLWVLQLFNSWNSLSCDTYSNCVTGWFLHSRKKFNIFAVNVKGLIYAKIRTVYHVWTPQIWAPNLISPAVLLVSLNNHFFKTSENSSLVCGPHAN